MLFSSPHGRQEVESRRRGNTTFLTFSWSNGRRVWLARRNLDGFRFARQRGRNRTAFLFPRYWKGRHDARAVETLALRIEDRLKHHKYCTVFEGELDRVWPREHSNDPRIPLIEKFAREHGWSVTFRDPGIRAVFRQAAAASAPPPRLRQRGNSRL